MDKFKIGLKIWSDNYNLFTQIKDAFNQEIISYVEVYVVPGTFQKFKDYFPKIPAIVHCTHFKHGFNLANENFGKNKEIFLENQKFADFLNARHIIVHPGLNFPLGNAKRNLDILNDSRIIIENLTPIGPNQEKFLGILPREIDFLCQEKYGFCLDFAHAINSAIFLKNNYKGFIKEFMKRNPSVFHISNGNLNNSKDEHLNLYEGEYDLRFIKDCILQGNSKMVSLETPKPNLESLENDIKNIKYFLNIK